VNVAIRSAMPTAYKAPAARMAGIKRVAEGAPGFERRAVSPPAPHDRLRCATVRPEQAMRIATRQDLPLRLVNGARPHRVRKG
jgi:hypothetical protein